MDLSFASSARTRAAGRARIRRLVSNESSPGRGLLQVEITECSRPLGSELHEAVRLLDGYGRLKSMYATIQAAISAAVSGDEVVIAPGVYAEDLHINSRLTLTRAMEGCGPERTAAKAVVVGHVIVAASAIELTVDGVAIEGGLTMQSVAGTTASITLRASGIQGSGVSCARLAWLHHARD